MIDVLHAVQYLHEVGLVHRDLKASRESPRPPFFPVSPDSASACRPAQSPQREPACRRGAVRAGSVWKRLEASGSVWKRLEASGSVWKRSPQPEPQCALPDE